MFDNRLLNLGIKVAPEWCANIVVLDCDILFSNNMWIARTLEALQTSLIVQPFSISYRMTGKDLATDLPSDSAAEKMFSHAHAVGMGEGQVSRNLWGQNRFSCVQVAWPQRVY